MKTLLTAAVLNLALLIPASAQTLDFNFDALAAKAKDKAEITLDRSLLKDALQSAPEKVKGAVANVNRLIVRHYEFEQKGQYSDADLQGLRKQISGGTGWSNILNVKNKDESTEIYLLNQGGKPAGFLLIAAEPKELTVVHVVGSIDLASLQEVVKSTIRYDLKGAEGQ